MGAVANHNRDSKKVEDRDNPQPKLSLRGRFRVWMVVGDLKKLLKVHTKPLRKEVSM